VIVPDSLHDTPPSPGASVADQQAQAWIQGCVANDRKVQEQMYRAYYEPFFKICLRYADDEQDAALWLNDGFLKIFTRICDFRGQGSLEGWMRRVVVNTCLDHLRQKASYRTVPLTADAATTPADAPVTLNDALSQIQFRELTALIQHLPVASRTVFNLCVFEGFSHREIAQALNIREGTSQWHVNRARELLKARILQSSQTHRS
jgi:RNA polymerase sigma-70 factor (ECF subfamily)